MHFAVLGELQVRGAAGDEIRLAAPMRRQLLAALLCRAGRPVTADALINDLWGELAPRSAPKTLQSHVVRLRDDLGRDGPSVLRTATSGYQLDVGPDEVDALRFERLTRDVADESPVAAVDRLTAALELWRDDAYLEFGDAAFAVAERLRLTELRGAAEDSWTDLSISLGRSALIVGELERRVALEPYRERSWEQLIIALYAGGRQADALAAFDRVRDVLASDLGVDPGPALRALQSKILNQDRDLFVAPRDRLTVVEPHAELVGRCPYPGLAGFAEDDAGLFVGRERVVAELAGRLAAQRLVVVTGPSGSGKSSLVHAGLLPALRAGAIPGSAAWRTTVCTPGSAVAAQSGDLLVVDQAEELFTVLNAAERTVAERAVVDRIADGGRVVLVLRGDFFDRLTELGRLAAMAHQTVLVRPMRDDEIRRAILEPAERCGTAVEPAMLDAVLDEISGRPAALPLLSVALARAWRNRSGDRITLDGYRRGGGMSGAIEAGAEEAWAAIPEAHRPAARRTLLRLVSTEGGGWVRRPLPLADVDPDVLTPLTGRRLVTVNRNRVELVHEALLDSWQRLRHWLEERARSAELLDHLGAAALTWDVAGRPDADLYRGGRLAAAEEWSVEHPDDLGEREQKFVAASTAAADRELSQARARATREAAGRRRLRYAVAGLVVVLVGAVLAAVVAVRAQRDARRSADAADAAALSADARRLSAEALAAPDLRTGLLLATAAYRLQPSVDTKAALLSAVEKNGGALWRVSTPQRVQWVGANAAGTEVWQADNQQSVTRYDARTRAVLSHYPYAGHRIQSLSPDGRLLLVAGTADPSGDNAGVLSVRDAATGALRRLLPGFGLDGGNDVSTAAFTGDGRWIVSLAGATTAGATSTNTVYIFDVAHLDAAPRRLTLDAPGTAVATGRSSFVVTSGKGTVSLVDAASLRVQRTGHRSGLPSGYDIDTAPVLTLSPDATTLAAIVGHGPPTLWRTADLSGPAVPTQLADQAWQASAFAPDGSRVVFCSDRGDVTVLDTGTGKLALSLPGEDAAVLKAAWVGASGHQELFSGGLDSQLVSWDLSTTPRMMAVGGPSYPVGAFGVHGHLLTGYDDVAALFGGQVTGVDYAVTDLRNGSRRLFPMHLHDGDNLESSTADAAGDRTLLTIQDSAGRHRCELWDVARGARLGVLALSVPGDVAAGCALSPDGSLAVATVGVRRFATYRTPDFTPIRTFDVHLPGAEAAGAVDVPQAFAPDGDIVVTATAPDTVGADRLLAVVDTAGRVRAQMALGAGNDLMSIDWSPDRSRIVVGTSGGDIRLLDAATLRPLVAPVNAAAGYVLAATFSPDGATVLTSGTDSTVRLFDAATLRAIGPSFALPGDDWAYAGWTGTGEQIAGYGRFDPASPQASRFTLPGDPAVWARTACAIAGSDFSAAEWTRYVGDRPYDPVCG